MSVMDNVNKLFRRMTFNTQSRIIKFMADDDDKTVPFWDCNQFDERIFANFSPDDRCSVVDLMHHSWHKAFDLPLMVQTTKNQYQTSAIASPFEEIDDVIGSSMLFQPVNRGHAVSDDKAKRLIRDKKAQTCDCSGSASPDQTISSCRNSSHTICDSRPDKRFGATPGKMQDSSWAYHADSHRTFDMNVYAGNEKKLQCVDFNNGSVSEENEPRVGYTVTRKVSETRFTDGEQAPIKAPEYSYAPKPPSQKVGRASFAERIPAVISGGESWRTRLIDDHKRRLIERWPDSQRPRDKSFDPNTYIEWAITQGYLKPLAHKHRKTTVSIGSPSVVALSRLPSYGAAQTSYPEVSSDSKPNSLVGSVGDLSLPTSLHPHSVILAKNRHTEEPYHSSRKRRKVITNGPEILKSDAGPSSNYISNPISHRSAPDTIENHQRVPPLAYFEKKIRDEQPAWQCGISHCMGIYYNAGDRKNCVGCFTSFRKKENPKREVMGFYLPSRSYWFCRTPHRPWNVSKPSGKPRHCSHMSHNSIAKDAYWQAVSTGANDDQAWKCGIDAVEAHVLAGAKKKEKKMSKLKPNTESADPEPHPSGSVTMEHGQTLPIGASFKKLSGERYRENAWRCDINHALGRYYMAGDVKSCQGCGSSRNGQGKHTRMDFYLPAGAVVRQRAPSLVKWKPRKDYSLAKKGKRDKQCVTHNQIASREYWNLVAQGFKHVEGSYDTGTLTLAIEATEQHIDAKAKAMEAKMEANSPVDGNYFEDRSKSKRGQRAQTDTGGQRSGLRQEQGHTYPLSLQTRSCSIPQKRRGDDMNSGDFDGANEYETG